MDKELRVSLAELTHGMDQRNEYIRQMIRTDLGEHAHDKESSTWALLDTLNTMIESKGDSESAVIATLAKSKLVEIIAEWMQEFADRDGPVRDRE